MGRFPDFKMKTTTLNISEELSPRVEVIITEFGFKDREEFFQEAIRDKVLELQKKLFFKGSDEIAGRLRKKRISEKEVLNEFSERKHQ